MAIIEFRQQKVQRSRSYWSFEVFVAPVSWPYAYLTDSLYMSYKYNPWKDGVSRTVSRSKGSKVMVTPVIGIFGVSAPWLCAYHTESVHRFNPQGDDMAHIILQIKKSKVKGHSRTGRSYLRYWPWVVKVYEFPRSTHLIKYKNNVHNAVLVTGHN